MSFVVEYVKICAHGDREITNAASVQIAAQWDRVAPENPCAPHRFERREVTYGPWERVEVPEPECLTCGDLGVMCGSSKTPCTAGCRAGQAFIATGVIQVRAMP